MLAVAACSAAVGSYALREGLDKLADGARAELAQAADKLTGQLQCFGELAVLLIDHPALAALAETGQGDRATADALLLRAADRTASEEILLLGRKGQVLASSRGRDTGRTDRADRACVMETGRVVREGPVSELKNDQSVIDAYLGAAH